MCNIRSSDLLMASMFGALGALGCLYAGSHLAARNGSTWLIWVGCAVFGLFQGPMWPAMESLLSEECAIASVQLNCRSCCVLYKVQLSAN
jgi:hypothetical protein